MNIVFFGKELPYCHGISRNADKHWGFRAWQFSKNGENCHTSAIYCHAPKNER